MFEQWIEDCNLPNLLWCFQDREKEIPPFKVKQAFNCWQQSSYLMGITNDFRNSMISPTIQCLELQIDLGQLSYLLNSYTEGLLWDVKCDSRYDVQEALKTGMQFLLSYLPSDYKEKLSTIVGDYYRSTMPEATMSKDKLINRHKQRKDNALFALTKECSKMDWLQNGTLASKIWKKEGPVEIKDENQQKIGRLLLEQILSNQVERKFGGIKKELEDLGVQESKRELKRMYVSNVERLMKRKIMFFRKNFGH